MAPIELGSYIVMVACGGSFQVGLALFAVIRMGPTPTQGLRGKGRDRRGRGEIEGEGEGSINKQELRIVFQPFYVELYRHARDVLL